MRPLLADTGCRTRMPSGTEGLGIDDLDDLVMRRIFREVDKFVLQEELRSHDEP